MIRFVSLITILFFVSISTRAQDTLPNFTVRLLSKDKVQVSWINPYPNCVQISIQRSYDSLKFFKTIFTPQSPELPQSGYVDKEFAIGVKAYYRIFYVLSGGNYFFSKSKSSQSFNAGQSSNRIIFDTALHANEEKKYITIYKSNKDSFINKLEFKDFNRFKDSIIAKTKDTLLILSADEVIIKPYVPKPVWKPSPYVFTSTNGYVNIYLPLIKQHKYRIVFFDDRGKEIFQIKQIKEEPLVLDKTNFLHAGWFFFELYEDDKLKEKNSLYLERDF
jgi:hypothetical protein